MEWPYRRFIKAFDAFQRRLACEDLRARRTAHVAVLYGIDLSEDTDRGELVRKVELAYEALIVEAWNGPEAREAVDEEIESSPFMQASRRSVAAMIQPPVLPGETAIGALPG